MTRQEQRQAERRVTRTALRQKTQVFAFEDSNGVNRALNVEAMRVWAEKSLRLVGVDIDINKVEDMLKRDRIDREHVMKHTMCAFPKPILVCDDFEDGRAEIVDGNHTYVAMAIAQAKAAEMGIVIPFPLRAPAYVFDRKDWTRFLV